MQFINTITKTYNFFFNYPTPGNLTNVWNFGVLGFGFLSLQLISGLILSLYYIPEENHAFIFVESIMRDSYFGYFFRYVHANGASFFFFVIYIHFFRSLYYFSYMKPKLIVWNTGSLIFVLMIVAAFTGYVLPWGQMSFRAATVITNLVTVLPFFGTEIVEVLWGSYSVTTITLNRFYTAHFFIPFVILFIVCAHFIYLHNVGSSNNLFIENNGDKLPFHPYYTIKDLLVVIFALSFYFIVCAYLPNYFGHTDNYIQANSVVTPNHIVPEWYFLAFYAILRSVPHKLAGVLLMFGSLAILFIFPFFVKYYYNADLWCKTKYKGCENKRLYYYNIIAKRYDPFTQTILFWIFVANFIGLSFIGMMPVESPYDTIGLIMTFIYFGFFCASLYIHSMYYWVEYWEEVEKEHNIYLNIKALYKSISSSFFTYLVTRERKKVIKYLEEVEGIKEDKNDVIRNTLITRIAKAKLLFFSSDKLVEFLYEMDKEEKLSFSFKDYEDFVKSVVDEDWLINDKLISPVKVDPEKKSGYITSGSKFIENKSTKIIFKLKMD